jgi:hypothetical protein
MGDVPKLQSKFTLRLKQGIAKNSTAKETSSQNQDSTTS